MSLLALAFILDAVILTAFVFLALKKVKPQKVPGQNIEQAQQKSFQLLHRAIKKAEDIVQQTNRQQTNLVSEVISETAQSKQLFDAQLKSFLDNLTASHQEYLKFLENLKAGAQKAQFDNLNIVKQTTSQLFLQFEQERTLSMVLPKKLNLNDQVELIYESLEKAKAEKFII